MDEEKTRTIAARLSQSDYEKLRALKQKTSTDTNMRVTTTGMISKLIRDAYDGTTQQ